MADRLLTKRRAIVAHVVAIDSYLDGKKDVPDIAVAVSANALKGKREALLSYEKKFEENFEAILEEGAVGADAMEAAAEYVRFTEILMRAVTTVDQLLEKYPTPPAANPPATQKMKMCSIPKTTLKKFDGMDPTGWSEFWDYFEAAIENSDFPKVEKFRILKECCEGEAGKLLAPLKLTNENYDIARALLESRFGRKEQIKEAHFAKLFALKSVPEQDYVKLKALVTDVTQSVQSLKNLKEPVQHWDSILIYIVKNKLDCVTRKDWEIESRKLNRDMKLNDLLEFILDLAQALELSVGGTTRKVKSHVSNAGSGVLDKDSSKDEGLCFLCKGQHFLARCQKYWDLSVKERRSKIRELRLCYNCFSKKHGWAQCPHPASCRKCDKYHHPTLHRNQLPQSQATVVTETPFSDTESESGDEQEVLVQSVHAAQSAVQDSAQKTVLIATALVKVGGHVLRAMVDPGSQSGFVTENCIQKCGLQTSSTDIKVVGIGGTISDKASKCAVVRMSDVNGRASVTMNALVYSKISKSIPNEQFPVPEELKYMKLADPCFNKPGKIDLLLGADMLPEILLPEPPMIRGSLVLQPTIFGLIISGTIKSSKTGSVQSGLAIVAVHRVQTFPSSLETESLDRTLKTFFELESVPASGKAALSLEEKRVEQHFTETCERLENGQYQVALPFRKGAPVLGKTREKAKAFYWKMQARLSKNPELKAMQQADMEQYFELGHAELVPPEDKNKPENAVFYLPYHPVLKADSSTTKCRNVFNGSFKTEDEYSLNDHIMVGPNIQRSLFQILIRFGTYRLAFTADAFKMYRSIRLAPPDRDYHRFWCKVDGRVEECRMTTVTFGIGSSAHHAQRVLHQLASDEGGHYPAASRILLEDLYMDDVVSGADTLELALVAQKQLSQCLDSAKFRLRKWASNDPRLLEAIPEGDRQPLTSLNLDLEHGGATKTLGVCWNPGRDTMSIQVHPVSDENKITKRFLASDSARIFDPLGFLSPTTFRAKLFFKETCQAGVDWDELVPEDTKSKWKTWRIDLVKLNGFEKARCVVPSSTDVDYYELHGFSDASELGFAACVYLRTVLLDGTVTVNLITGKAKVAPMKRITLPRLELCGASLLAQLLSVVQDAIQFPVQIFAWTDSTVTLYWIIGNPNRWKTFVGNKVSSIQDLVEPSKWRYVPSKQNPADCASRGLTAQDLMNHKMWWNGPDFLLNRNTSTWPSQPQVSTETNQETVDSAKVEANKTETISSVPAQIELVNHVDKSIINRFSSKDRLIRFVAYGLRWKDKADVRSKGCLKPEELERALLRLVQSVQSEYYGAEIKLLQVGKDLDNKSSLLPLSVFLDDNSVLRVGGRLAKSNQLDYGAKHQILLPPDSHFAKLVILDIHLKNCHSQPNLTLAILRQKFWVTRGLIRVRSVIHSCVLCVRHKAKTLKQIMGNLPAARVDASARAFLKSGVDYAGPFLIISKYGKRYITSKAWICFFCCMSTKAYHLEAVQDLTAESFKAALKRFVSRRGLVSDLYSDNGTNFHGCERDLREFLSSLNVNELIESDLANDRIKWHFSPERGSHFGGLWESGIKNVKSLLKKELGDRKLTYQELCTLLCKVEACLNSRPITQLSSSPDDLDYLTPGHFLIGGPLRSVPDWDVSDVKLNRLDRWQYVESMFQRFWKRYMLEYVHTLQMKNKWLKAGTNLKVKDLVLLKDEDLPPLKWKLGRVIELYPGTDGKVRVVKIKTSTGTFKRPVVKLTLLLPSLEV